MPRTHKEISFDAGEKLGLGRRDFVRLGLAMPLLPLWGTGGLAKGTHPSGKILSPRVLLSGTLKVAYRPTQAIPQPEWLEAHPNALLDAKQLKEGESGFANNGARLTVLGFHPETDHRVLDKITSIALDVSYHPFHSTSFQAWHCNNGEVFNVSAPSAFTVPIERTSGLNLSLEIRSSSWEERIPIRLSLGREANAPKLRRGTYLFDYNNKGVGSFGLSLSVERAGGSESIRV